MSTKIGRQPVDDIPYPREFFQSRIYRCWGDMKTRCSNPNWKNYGSYGGRGIKVCPRWMSFANFLEDMGATYSDDLTLDRIDNNGDYTPENCRWADKLTQANNTRTTPRIDHRGESLTMAEWAKKVGMKYETLRQRYRNYGWDFEKSLTTPTRTWGR